MDRPPPRISDYVRLWADATPDAVAFTCEGTSTTYRRLAADVDDHAEGLLALGVHPGDRVALAARPCPDAITLYLAAASIGAVFQGLNPAHTCAELEHVLADSRPVLVLDAVDGRALAAAAAVGVRLARPWSDGALDGRVGRDVLTAARAAVAPADPVLLVHTSGSTGTPKGALIPTGSLAHAAWVHAGRWATGDAVTTVCPFPVSHVASLSDVCGTALAAGARTVFLPDFDPRALVRLLERERVTLWGFVPAMAMLATQTPEWPGADLSALRQAVWGGGAASGPLLAALEAKGLLVSGCYGSTETVGNVCFTDADGTAFPAATIGRPDPHYDVRVVDGDGKECAVGVEGELLVAAEHAFAGYLGRPDATAEVLVDGWLHTGDVAVRHPDGSLSLVGRVREMYKSGGYNVYPREVELALEDLPGVELAAVVWVADPLYGEVGHAFAVAPGTDPEQLREALRQRLAAYKVPKRLELVDAMPLLAVGKIDKAELGRRAGRGAT